MHISIHIRGGERKQFRSLINIKLPQQMKETVDLKQHADNRKSEEDDAWSSQEKYSTSVAGSLEEKTIRSFEANNAAKACQQQYLGILRQNPSIHTLPSASSAESKNSKTPRNKKRSPNPTRPTPISEDKCNRSTVEIVLLLISFRVLEPYITRKTWR